MSWKRGLFRLWVVCSLLWFVVTTPVVIDFFSDRQFLQTASEKAECEAARAQGSSSWSCFARERKVWRWPPWWALAIEAAVPLVLLGLGATTYWVAVGFKRPN